MKKISIITPCYNEKENLIECCDRVKKIFNSEIKNYDYEHIIIDNNSSAETYKIIQNLTKNDEKIKAIINNKNYGVVVSCNNAFKFTNGDAVITHLASDLQDPPEMIPKFIKKWEEGYDFVIGIKKKRQEFFLLTFIRKIFFIIISKIARKNIFYNISEYQILDSKIVKKIKEIEHPFFSRTLAFDFSDNYAYLEYEWVKRKRGKTTANFFEYFSTAVLGVIFVSENPFRILLYFGFFVSIFSLIYLLKSIIIYFITGPQTLPGITLIIVILLIFLSLSLLVLGLMGEYIIYIFNCLGKKRSLLIKEKINFKD